MSRGARKRIALGVYRDASGYSVIWREGGKSKEVRFDHDTPIYRLKDYRREQVDRVASQPKSDPRHGLARDVVRFLKLRKGRAGFKSERAHLRAWVHRFPRTSRWALTREQCQQAIADWLEQGYSPKSIRHRVQILAQLFRALDGSHVRTPVDDIDLPAVQRPRPVSVSDHLVREVALELRKHELIGRLRDAKTRARYLVLATTGQRPAQMRRATPDTIDLARRVWFVNPAKGDRGAIVYLNDDMHAAWSLFIAADAWGAYDGRSFVRTLHRCGWPKGVRPYNLRHTIGLTLSELGVDLGDIQAHMGHSSLQTTRTFYVPAVPDRLKQASQKLDGRLTGAAVPYVRSTNARGTRSQKKELQAKTAGVQSNAVPLQRASHRTKTA